VSEGDEDEGDEVQPDLGGIDIGAVAADRAAAFELTQPALTTRDAERQTGRELGDGESALLLKRSKNLLVGGRPQRKIMA
jgi:hypothetical protein